MKNFYEIVIATEREQEDGTMKKVTEKYLVRNDECLITDAINEISQYETGAYEVRSAKRTKITDLFGSGDAEHIYGAKVQFITIDEKTAKEKIQTIEFVVWADTIVGAKDVLDKAMNDGLVEYKITDIHETGYIDLY